MVAETEAIFPTDTDPLGVYTLVVPVPVFKVSVGGRYIFGAYHHNIPIASSPINIIGPGQENQNEN
jgi:hypothetical protein